TVERGKLVKKTKIAYDGLNSEFSDMWASLGQFLDSPFQNSGVFWQQPTVRYMFTECNLHHKQMVLKTLCKQLVAITGNILETDNVKKSTCCHIGAHNKKKVGR
ncbi:hypothetical protein ACJX0J_039273, partial [Zea mays]